MTMERGAGRRHFSRDFVRVLISDELVNARRLLLRISQLPRSDRLPVTLRKRIETWVRGPWRLKLRWLGGWVGARLVGMRIISGERLR